MRVPETVATDEQEDEKAAHAAVVADEQVDHERPASLPAMYRALWQHAEGVRHLIFGAFALLLASQLFKLAVPWFAGNAINAIQKGGG